MSSKHICGLFGPGVAESVERHPSAFMNPIVLIDISGRVQRELDKNGGKPSPDTSVTDFGESSGNVVTAADVEAVADQLVDGAWLVMNLVGWIFSPPRKFLESCRGLVE